MKQSRRGQAAVELALVLPLVLVLLVGIVEFGRAWNQQQVITDAAREAARKAAIYDPAITQDSVINRAKSALAAAGINPAKATITAPGWDAGANFDVVVTIQLPYQFTFFGPLVKWATGKSNLLLQTSFTMRNEG